MSNEELSNWLLNKLNSCYQIITEDKKTIFWIYDEKFIRKQKLCKLNNQEIKQPTKFDNAQCIFEQTVNCTDLWIDEKIWNFFYEQTLYSNNKPIEVYHVRQFIDNNVIIKNKKLEGYTCVGTVDCNYFFMKYIKNIQNIQTQILKI